MNILFSSTRQWNPGDEFIFFGIKNLMEEFFNSKKINWILYDRNPDTFISMDNNNHREILWGNSFHGSGEKVFDLALIAGSPEWTGKPLSNFYKYVAKNELKLVVLGAGYIDAPIQFTDEEKLCFKKYAKIITVRDEFAFAALKSIGITSNILPCPALFAAKKEFPANKIKKIGFVLQTDKTVNQSISKELKHACMNSLHKLRKKGYEVEIVCNYIDEFVEFEKKLSPVRYSYDAADYIKILADYDLIVSTRLHGAILANSLGKPSILINSSDSRLKGGKAMFPYIKSSSPDLIVEAVLGMDIKQFSDLKVWKSNIKEKYLKLLGQKFSGT